MKLATFIFFVIGFNQLYSQNISLEQLTKWRKTDYKVVEKELMKIGWKKIVTEKLEWVLSDIEANYNK